MKKEEKKIEWSVADVVFDEWRLIVPHQRTSSSETLVPICISGAWYAASPVDC